MLSHIAFKALVDTALPNLSPQESMALRAVALHETSYGAGWGDPEHTAEPDKARSSRNMGAITMQPLERHEDGTVECGAGGFRHGDSRREGGKVVRYETCFRAYPSDEAAVQHLAKVLLKPNVRAAAKSRSIDKIARAMRDNNYYLGIAPTRQGQIDAYASALRSAMGRIRKGTGEPDPLVEPGPATLLHGAGLDFLPRGSSTPRNESEDNRCIL